MATPATSYSASSIIKTMPAEYRGTVTLGTLSADVAGAVISTDLVVGLYGEGVAYASSFYITQKDSARLSLATRSSVTLKLDSDTQSVRLIGSHPFAGGITRWDSGPIA